MSWRRVYESIRSDIESGRLAPGAALPTQAVLAARHDASRHAVRRALRTLAERGFVASWQGKGAEIRRNPVEHDLGEGADWCALATERGLRVTTEPLGKRICAAGRGAAEHLKLAPGRSVLVEECLVRLDGCALQIVRHHVEAERFRRVLHDRARHASLRDALGALDPTTRRRLRSRLAARLPTAKETVLLGLPPAQPVMDMLTCTLDAEGTPLVVTETVSRSEGYCVLV